MATKIPSTALIDDFRRMLAEHWRYGSETKRGQVDCSGAFVWAYQQHGCSLYHGSNRMARVEAIALIPLAQAKVVPGMAAFKLRAPGSANYALPASYKPGGAWYTGDLNDYYHVGLVDADTTRVLNAQGTATGFVASPITQNWSHVAYLRQVDYAVPATAPATATVTAANGKPVKLRAQPSTACALYWEVPVGTQLTLRGAPENGWTPVSWSGHDGYMMTEFLT